MGRGGGITGNQDNFFFTFRKVPYNISYRYIRMNLRIFCIYLNLKKYNPRSLRRSKVSSLIGASSKVQKEERGKDIRWVLGTDIESFVSDIRHSPIGTLANIGLKASYSDIGVIEHPI
jgi:hypothetical protein